MQGGHVHDGDWGWGGWLPMTLAMQAFLTLVAWGVFLVWRSTRYPDAADARQRSAARQSPEEILAERLARGEIDPNEYRARLEVLRSSGP